jgi:uncharacterized protein involved in outer membrane biogenesis
MKKTIKILAFLSIITLLPMVILVLFSPYFLNAYKDQIAKTLGEELHRRIEIKKISLTLWTGLGLSVEGLKIHNEQGFKNDLLLNMDSLNLSFEFWPLLRQKIESRGIVINHPQLFIETNLKGISNLSTLATLATPERSENRKKPEGSASGPEILPGIAISKLLIVNGSISDENSLTKDAAALDGINLNLTRLSYAPDGHQPGLVNGISVEGEIDIRQGKINPFHFEKLAGHLFLEKMRIHLKEWTMKSYGGSIQGDLRLNLGEKPLQYEFSGKADKINLQALVNENSTSQNVIAGDFYSMLSAKGAGLTLKDMENHLSGKGAFALKKGSLKTVNLLKQIAVLSRLNLLQQNRGLEETTLESLNGDFVIDHGKMLFHSLRGATPEGEITGDGSVDFHKNIDFRLKVVLNQNETERLPKEAKPFLAGENGRAEFPVTLRGSLSSPAVRLETAEIRQKAVKEGVKQGIKSLLDRFAPR